MIRNILANYFGKFYNAILQFLLVPFYLRLLGIESYALIGFYGTMAALLALLQLGFGSAASRELARLSASQDTLQQQRKILRTLEVLYWAATFVICAIVQLSAPFIVEHWIHAQSLSPPILVMAIRLMGFVFALEFPTALYLGGLNGLQRQVRANIILCANTTLRNTLVIFCLYVFQARIDVFFLAQLAANGIYVYALKQSLWGALKGEGNPNFEIRSLGLIWRYAIGVASTSVLILLISQIDKILIPKLLSLEMFGYYSLAGAMTGAYAILSVPIGAAVYPRLCQIVEQGNAHQINKFYHMVSQTMAVVIFPVTFVLCFFSKEILLVWTSNLIVATNAAPALSVLILGSAISGIMGMPNWLQLANGFTRLIFYNNLILVIVLPPVAWVLIKNFGLPGAAICIVIQNISYFVTQPAIIHKKFLHGHLSEWYLRDVLIPMMIAFLPVVCLRYFYPGYLSNYSAVVYIFFTWVVSSIGIVFSTQHMRRFLFEYAKTKQPLFWRPPW